jgi:hypothetical protein
MSLSAVLYAMVGYLFFNNFLEKILGLLMFISPIIVLIDYYNKHLYDHFWVGVWSQTVLIMYSYLLFFLYNTVRKRWILRQQAARDHEAASILASIEGSSGTSERFALYLRPFTATKNIPTSLPGSYYTDSKFDGLIDFEAILEDAQPDATPLIALGHPNETYGAGRLTSEDETWKTKIIELMQGAKTIYVIPSEHAGTLWEISHMQKTQLIRKCIFIMPPTGAAIWRKEEEKDWTYDEPFVDEPSQWSTTRNALQAVGITLPEYDKAGAMFTITESGEVNSYGQLPLLLPKFTGESSYIHSLTELINNLQHNSKEAHTDKQTSSIKTFKLFKGKDAETEYNIAPGKFEINEFGDQLTFQGCMFFLIIFILVIYLTIHAFHNFHETLLVMAESALALIIVKIFLWPINQIGK